jgi:hypothetical protein
MQTRKKRTVTPAVCKAAMAQLAVTEKHADFREQQCRRVGAGAAEEGLMAKRKVVRFRSREDQERERETAHRKTALANKRLLARIEDLMQRTEKMLRRIESRAFTKPKIKGK